MDNLMTRQLNSILSEQEVDFERNYELEIKDNFLDNKGWLWLKEIYEEMGGKEDLPLLKKLTFDFKIKRNIILYDDELSFNRYRLSTFRSEMYSEMTFDFCEAQKRLCRSFEKECLKVGMQERIWTGAPVAKFRFGEASEPGDFSGNGSSGWKLQAYNNVQIDIQSRLHGYKLIRLSPFETLMTGGSLKRLDQLLINPKEEQRQIIFNWLMRKIES
jgi:hypothetical protein